MFNPRKTDQIQFALSSSAFVAGHLLFPVELDHVHALGVISDEVLAEIVGSYPEKVIVHITEAVTLSGEGKKIKTFVGPDERIDQPQSVSRMDVVINVSCGQEQPSFQIFCDLGVLLDAVFECDVPVFVHDLFDPVMLLAPPYFCFCRLSSPFHG